VIVDGRAVIVVKFRFSVGATENPLKYKPPPRENPEPAERPFPVLSPFPMERPAI
jgi:hypothetical protein